jgi:predicted amidohydrolase
MPNLGRDGHVKLVQLIGPDASGNDQVPQIIVDPLGVPRLAVDCTLAVAANIAVDGNVQVQTVDRALAALAPGTVNLASHDCIEYAGFGVSVYLARTAGDTTVDVVIETSDTGAGNWREVDRQVLTLSVASPAANLNRVYSPTRRFMRVTLVNNTAACNAEVVTLLKPIP